MESRYGDLSNLFTVTGICRKCGENVQCSIGLGFEGVFVVYIQNFVLSVFFIMRLHCSIATPIVDVRICVTTSAHLYPGPSPPIISLCGDVTHRPEWATRSRGSRRRWTRS